MRGRALRRALASRDADRVYHDLPSIVDTTEMITPEMAQEMLQRNKSNRPINWKRVDEYIGIMLRNEWELHAQGIVLDGDGNILTGQTRLWAVALSGCTVAMRVSRGSPASSARLLDRHRPQTARDLAARATGRRHSPTEASIARAVLVLNGVYRPSVDAMADAVEENAAKAEALLSLTTGTKKTKAVVMILGALCSVAPSVDRVKALAILVDALATRLVSELLPLKPEECWGKGAAFGLAMERARQLVADAITKVTGRAA